jgi:predicted nucleotide-binding protein (sugar kinase/HSP70/actin superfamily)
LNSFSNQNLIRRVEAAGGEVWIADISEWVWYTNFEQERKLREAGKGWSLPMAGARVRRWIQERDEKALMAPFARLFKTREETPVQTLLSYSQPYLPARKALGEMTLNVGKAVAFYRVGCDGVIDASPFTCMNGIVTEAVYPVVSRDHHNLPIRIFYFDGFASDLDRDLEIFMDLVKSYRQDRLSRA